MLFTNKIIASIAKFSTCVLFGTHSTEVRFFCETNYNADTYINMSLECPVKPRIIFKRCLSTCLSFFTLAKMFFLARV